MISIIIPVYNHAKALPKTLDSILAQTEKGIEIIIVNDGSTDNVQQAFEDYLKTRKLPDISIKFFNQENLGAPAARNRGLKEALGDFVFFCDADAVFKADALDKFHRALLVHAEASYAYSSFNWGRKLFKVGAFDSERLKQAPMIHTMALIRRKDLPVGGWDESIKKLQDWDLWLTMLEEHHIGYWIDEVLFTITPGGVYSNWVPAFAYKLLPFLPTVKKYKKAVAIVKAKHNLA